jgi:hypothetical protein
VRSHAKDRHSDRWPTCAIATQMAVQLREACATDIFTMFPKRPVVDKKMRRCRRKIDSQCRYRRSLHDKRNPVVRGCPAFERKRSMGRSGTARVQGSDPMPLDMNGEVPVSFTITLRPSAEGSSSLRTGGDQVGNQSAVPETSSLVSGQQAQSPSQKADRAIYWAHASAQQHADADAAYDLAKQNLGAINASCPDAILLQQTPQKAGPYKPVILFLSRQCGYIVSYWPESGEEQISFDRSMIESWSGYCSTRVGPRTTCLKGNGA